GQRPSASRRCSTNVLHDRPFLHDEENMLGLMDVVERVARHCDDVRQLFHGREVLHSDQMLGDYIQRHPGIVGVAIIAGLLIMLIRSVVRALQRWETIPDPLLPEKWRSRINAIELAALEQSADSRTYGAIAGTLSGGGGSS